MVAAARRTDDAVIVDARAWHRCMSLLRRCSADLRRLRAVHGLFVLHGLHHDTFALSRLILSFSSFSCGSGAAYASLLLRHSSVAPNSFILNTLIRANSRRANPHLALHYFTILSFPDHHSYAFAITACAAAPQPLVSAGCQLHSRVFTNGLLSADHFIQTALLRFYSKISITDALKQFDEISKRDAVHYDVIMNSYIHRDQPFHALQLFHNMTAVEGLKPDEFTLTTAITACAHTGSLDQGRSIHQYIELEKPECLYDPYVASGLVSMYSKCGSIDEAAKVFDEVPERNSYMWSSLIGGYAMHGLARESVICLDRMQNEDGLRPDGVIILNVLAACAHAGHVEEGLYLLSNMENHYGITPKHEHFSCAVDMLCRSGRLEDVVGLIRKMPMRPLASVWGSLLTGCRIHGNVELAETAVAELEKISTECRENDEGAYVQLSNIYLNANRKEEARKVRKLIGSKGVKKTAGRSVVEIDGKVNTFVARDQVHPQIVEISRMLDLLLYDSRIKHLDSDQEKLHEVEI